MLGVRENIENFLWVPENWHQEPLIASVPVQSSVSACAMNFIRCSQSIIKMKIKIDCYSIDLLFYNMDTIIYDVKD